MRNKFVVYTALFGNYDNLIDPQKKFEGCDFICFTDQRHITSDIWEIRIIDEIDLPSNMMNRKYKILPHLFLSEYESSMYVDSNIEILKNPADLANKYLEKYDFVMPKHFARNCLYKEAIECINLQKTSYNEAIKQIDFYKSQDFPEDYGLGENNILLRNHTKSDVKRIMTDWWKELNTHSKRDQLSLGYVLWKNNKQFNFMEETARGSKYFNIKLHNNEINKGFFGPAKNSFYEFLGNHPDSKVVTILVSVNKFIKSRLLK